MTPLIHLLIIAIVPKNIYYFNKFCFYLIVFQLTQRSFSLHYFATITALNWNSFLNNKY